MGVHKGEQPAGPQEQTDDQVRRQALKGEVSAEIYRETQQLRRRVVMKYLNEEVDREGIFPPPPLPP